MPAVAAADVPDCPTAPASYDGTDAVVAELRALRTDLVANCAAIAARITRETDQLGTALAPLGSPLPVSLDRGGTSDDPLYVDGSSGGAATLGADDGHPAFVRFASTETAPAEAATGVADLRTDVWFVAGLLATALLSYGLWRTVMPRA